eukprot:360502-Chlamydomonas_euryale.AAC.1
MPATRARWCMRRCLRPGCASASGNDCDPGALVHAAMPATFCALVRAALAAIMLTCHCRCRHLTASSSRSV